MRACAAAVALLARLRRIRSLGHLDPHGGLGGEAVVGRSTRAGSSDPRSGSHALAGSASAGLNGAMAGAMRSLTSSALIATAPARILKDTQRAAQVIARRAHCPGLHPRQRFARIARRRRHLHRTAEDDDKPVRFETEPMTTCSQRFEAGPIRLRPVVHPL